MKEAKKEFDAWYREAKRERARVKRATATRRKTTTKKGKRK